MRMHAPAKLLAVAAGALVLTGAAQAADSGYRLRHVDPSAFPTTPRRRERDRGHRTCPVRERCPRAARKPREPRPEQGAGARDRPVAVDAPEAPRGGGRRGRGIARAQAPGRRGCSPELRIRGRARHDLQPGDDRRADGTSSAVDRRGAGHGALRRRRRRSPRTAAAASARSCPRAAHRRPRCRQHRVAPGGGRRRPPRRNGHRHDRPRECEPRRAAPPRRTDGGQVLCKPDDELAARRLPAHRA